MASDVRMVVVNGVRYRPEHAPKSDKQGKEPEKAREPHNKKAQKPANKAAGTGDEK